MKQLSQIALIQNSIVCKYFYHQFVSIIKMHSLCTALRLAGILVSCLRIPFIRKLLMACYYLYLSLFHHAGWCAADHLYRQARRGGVGGHEEARRARQGRRAHQGQGGAGPGARGLAVHRGPEGDLRLLSRPRPQQLLQLWPPDSHRADVQSHMTMCVLIISLIKF